MPLPTPSPVPVALGPIPGHGFKSWSLFVICNVSWLASEDDSQLENLYREFMAYGEAIGPEHAAVWFWSQMPEGRQKGTLDSDRNAYLCRSLNLAPSQSPYLIFTTRYPGAALVSRYPETFPTIADLGNHSILSLNGVSPQQVAQILSKLADRVVTGNLQNLKIDSRQYWSAWQRAYEAIRSQITGLASAVTVSFDTGPVKAELNLSGKTEGPN